MELGLEFDTSEEKGGGGGCWVGRGREGIRLLSGWLGRG